MPAIVEQLLIEQGSDYRHEFPAERDGTTRSLLGWAARGVVRQHLSGDVLYDLPLTVAAGKIVLMIPGRDSAAWPWRRARYEVKLFGPQRQEERHAAGEIVVDPQLVRQTPD